MKPEIKMGNNMHIIIFILITLCFTYMNVFSKDIKDSDIPSALDSLLLDNKIDEFIKVFENSFCIDDVLKKNEIKLYQKLITRLTKLQKISPQESKRYIDTYEKLSDIYLKENAGYKSNKAYENFVSFLLVKDTINSLNQLNVAIIFRERFIKEKKTMTLDFFEKANYYYDSDQPDSAVIMMNKYFNEVDSNIVLSSIKDSLKIRSELLRDRLVLKSFLHNENKKKALSEKFQISYFYSIINSKQINNKFWLYKIQNSSKTTLARTSGLNCYSGEEHTINLSYFIQENINASFEFNSGELYFSNPTIVGLISKEKYTSQSKMYCAILNYSFSTHVGYRPFVGLGLGYADFKMKVERSLTKRYISDFYEGLVDLVLDDNGYGSPLFSLRFGIDYYLINPNISFGINVNYSHIFKDIFFINQNIYKGSIMLGYRF